MRHPAVPGGLAWNWSSGGSHLYPSLAAALPGRINHDSPPHVDRSEPSQPFGGDTRHGRDCITLGTPCGSLNEPGIDWWFVIPPGNSPARCERNALTRANVQDNRSLC